MKRIGLFCPPGIGHMNPMLVLGREFKKRGYSVCWIGVLDGKAQTEAAGLEYVPIGVNDFPLGENERMAAAQGERMGIRALRGVIGRIVRWNEIWLRDGADAVRSAGIEGLLIDQASPGAAAVAAKLNLPYVTVCNALAGYFDSGAPFPSFPWPYAESPFARFRNRIGNKAIQLLGQPIRRLVNAYRTKWGLLPVRAVDFSDSPLAVIAQQPEWFDFPRVLPDVFHYTGPFWTEDTEQTAFPFERLNGKPLIYASLGTVQNRFPSLFHDMATACERLNVQLVVALGRRGRQADSSYPGDTIVVDWAPQWALLERATAVISHAGLNTVLGALYWGVPLVTIPISADQPGAAARVVHVGAGEMVKQGKATPERLQAAVARILTDPRYRRTCETLRDRIRQIDGAKRAIDIAERALLSGKPILRSGEVSAARA